jgi:hypothetical protein
MSPFACTAEERGRARNNASELQQIKNCLPHSGRQGSSAAFQCVRAPFSQPLIACTGAHLASNWPGTAALATRRTTIPLRDQIALKGDFTYAN